MKADVVIIGAGPAGLSFACSLENTGLGVLVIEKLPADALANPGIDRRDIALTHLSRAILQQLGAWHRMPTEEIFPIREARVVDGDSPYKLQFDRHQEHDDVLGFLVSNHLIRKALYEQALEGDHIGLATETTAEAIEAGEDGARIILSDGKSVQAPLVVAADSRFSENRRKMGIAASMHDFGRVAIVGRMQHEKSNDAIAWECFHYGQTLAVLPLSQHESSVVITLSSNKAKRFMDMTAPVFAADVERRFHGALGAMTLAGERYAYPLVAVWARQFVTQRFALIGDAAVGMHPVTAHGFNLGLRGQDTLAGLVREATAAGRDIGAESLLSRYQSTHRRAAQPIYVGTNAIVKLFTNDRPLHRLARKGVLRLGNMIPTVRNTITRQLTETTGLRGVS